MNIGYLEPWPADGEGAAVQRVLQQRSEVVEGRSSRRGPAVCSREVVVVAELLSDMERRPIVSDQLTATSGPALLGSMVERGAASEQTPEPVADADMRFGGKVPGSCGMRPRPMGM